MEWGLYIFVHLLHTRDTKPPELIPSIERTLLKPGVSSHDFCSHVIPLESCFTTNPWKTFHPDTQIIIDYWNMDDTFIYTIYIHR